MPAPQQTDQLQARFDDLKQQWKQGTKWLSCSHAITTHPAYQEIAAMGKDALPLILRDLEENGPDHWFEALSQITGAHPILEKDWGYMDKMSEAWLDWAKSI
jgi:hypothetical protein